MEAFAEIALAAIVGGTKDVQIELATKAGTSLAKAAKASGTKLDDIALRDALVPMADALVAAVKAEFAAE
jgi:hypothetical protein